MKPVNGLKLVEKFNRKIMKIFSFTKIDGKHSFLMVFIVEKYE